MLYIYHIEQNCESFTLNMTDATTSGKKNKNVVPTGWKRCMGPSNTEYEKGLLSNTVGRYISIIEDESMDSSSDARKKKAWNTVAS